MARRWWQEYQVDLPSVENEHWKIEPFEVPEESIEGLRLLWQGRGISPGTYTRLMKKSENGGGHLVMSDTPAEIRDHLGFIQEATGRVLLHGLGLGMCLKAALAKPEVTHVDVVEISQPLIDLVAPHYTDRRVSVYQGDALTFRFPKGTSWDVVWHDIWDDICTDNWDDMKTLRRRYGRRCSWQGCWAYAEIQRHRREESSQRW